MTTTELTDSPVSGRLAAGIARLASFFENGSLTVELPRSDAERSRKPTV